MLMMLCSSFSYSNTRGVTACTGGVLGFGAAGPARLRLRGWAGERGALVGHADALGWPGERRGKEKGLFVFI
jgi:hypothetical protein